MGNVYLAEDMILGRRVALKFLPEAMQQDARARGRLLGEARAAAALDHPYICKIYEVGESEGRNFIAMEYVAGETLQQRLAGKSLPLKEALRVAVEIAEALEEAHQQGTVHRDLKPANIMLTAGGHVKVMDFGLAKRVVPLAGVGPQDETLPGSLLGTLSYMSPEQIRGQAVDLRSDVFSFGILLYEMLAGVHPFLKDTPINTADAVLNATPEPLKRYRADVPELLQHAVRKMLAKEPARRYQSMHEVHTDLAQLWEEGRAWSTSPKRALSLWSFLLAGALVTVLVVAGMLTWNAWDRITGSRPPDIEAVAVLPFKNDSPDRTESDYLADGLTEDLITRLTQLEKPRMISFVSSRRYKDSPKSLAQIAEEMNVQAFITGTLRRERERLRVTIALVEAASGTQLWAHTFEEPLSGLLEVQANIARSAASQLKGKLTGEEEQTLSQQATKSVEAYDYYLRGAAAMQDDSPESTDSALEFFEKALELDENLAQAHVGIGTVYLNRYWFGEGGINTLKEAAVNYQRALRIKPSLGSARRGLIHWFWHEGKSEECLKLGLEAKNLPRQDVDTLFSRGEGYFFGNLPDRAAPLFERVVELDPANEGALYFLVMCQAHSANYLRAITTAEKLFLPKFGFYPFVEQWLGYSYDQIGNDDQAVRHYETALKVFPGLAGLDVVPWLAILYKRAGHLDQARAILTSHRQVLGERLKEYPDNFLIRAQYALLNAYLGDKRSFLSEEAAILANQPENGFLLTRIAKGHAVLGETSRAVFLLQQALKSGFVGFQMVHTLRQFGVESLENSRDYQIFRRQHEQAVSRLRSLY